MNNDASREDIRGAIDRFYAWYDRLVSEGRIGRPPTLQVMGKGARSFKSKCHELFQGAEMDSQNKYWFPAKRYGWGWGLPVRWEGWVCLAIYAGGVALVFRFLRPTAPTPSCSRSAWRCLPSA